MDNLLLIKIIEESDRYATRRKFLYKQCTKKISPENLRSEIILARILGELSGAERILQAIIQNSNWISEDIEAELHVFIKDLNNIAVEHLNSSNIIGVNDVLEIHGYFKKKD